MKTQTFGVEIEMTGLTREEVAKVIARYFGTRVNRVDDRYKVSDTTGRLWSVVYDGSLDAQRKNELGRLIDANDDYRVELVTPILRYDDIETLQEIVRAVRNAGAFVNSSCGVHVHIGAKDFTAKQLRNLLNYVASREEIFYAALKVAEYRKRRYCKPADLRIIREIFATCIHFSTRALSSSGFSTAPCTPERLRRTCNSASRSPTLRRQPKARATTPGLTDSMREWR